MRHRFIFSLSVLVAAAFVVTSCAEQGTTEPTAGTAPALADGDGPLMSAHAGNPVIFSARGSGHTATEGTTFIEQGWRSFTFNAVQRHDGTTTGHMRYDVHDQGDPQVTHKQHGRVFCMADLGNGVVAIGAEATLRSPDDTPPSPSAVGLPLPDADRPNGNHGLLFVVRDNGEGANASADEFTGVIHTLLNLAPGVPFLGDICLNPQRYFGPRPDLVAEQFFNPVQAGNIQVTFP